MTPATRAKRHAAAVAAITKRHTRDGDARTLAHHGARVGDWTLLSTDGCTALLTRTSAPTIDRDDSRILSGTPRPCAHVPDLTGPIRRCLPLAGKTRGIWLAAAVERVWTVAYDGDGDWGREWTPAASWHVGAPVCYDARYLLEAFRLLAPAGERVTWRAHDVADVKRPDGVTLLESADGQWAYLVMPMTGDRRAAADLIPRADVATGTGVAA